MLQLIYLPGPGAMFNGIELKFKSNLLISIN
jgi:hypothetical protein